MKLSPGDQYYIIIKLYLNTNDSSMTHDLVMTNFYLNINNLQKVFPYLLSRQSKRLNPFPDFHFL